MTLDRTMFASQGFTFADRFHTCFIGRQVEGYKLFLTAPEGQSTGGGLQAMQHITLQDETSNRTIVLGSAHGVDKRVELRSYESIGRVFAKRFPGVAFPIPRDRYDELQESFIKFFEMLKFEVEIESASTDAAPAAKSTASPAPSLPSPHTSPPSRTYLSRATNAWPGTGRALQRNTHAYDSSFSSGSRPASSHLGSMPLLPPIPAARAARRKKVSSRVPTQRTGSSSFTRMRKWNASSSGRLSSGVSILAAWGACPSR